MLLELLISFLFLVFCLLFFRKDSWVPVPFLILNLAYPFFKQPVIKVYDIIYLSGFDITLLQIVVGVITFFLLLKVLSSMQSFFLFIVFLLSVSLYDNIVFILNLFTLEVLYSQLSHHRKTLMSLNFLIIDFLLISILFFLNAFISSSSSLVILVYSIILISYIIEKIYRLFLDPICKTFNFFIYNFIFIIIILMGTFLHLEALVNLNLSMDYLAYYHQVLLVLILLSNLIGYVYFYSDQIYRKENLYTVISLITFFTILITGGFKLSLGLSFFYILTIGGVHFYVEWFKTLKNGSFLGYDFVYMFIILIIFQISIEALFIINNFHSLLFFVCSLSLIIVKVLFGLSLVKHQVGSYEKISH